MTTTTAANVADQLAAMLDGFKGLGVAPVSEEHKAEVEWAQAWYGLSKKGQETAPRLAIVEVTAHGDVARYTLHNIGGLGVPVAEQRIAKMTAASGRTYAIRFHGGAQ